MTNLLIVEDNREGAEALVMALSHFGFRCEVIGHSGKCLLTLPEDFVPDKILIDASLPPAFIAQVLEQYQKPVIGITAGQERNPALPEGTRVLSKPVEPSMVASALEAA